MTLVQSLADQIAEGLSPSKDEIPGVEKARESLREYVDQAWHVIRPATPFISGWHIDAICDHLQAVSRGDIQNLIINIPPRHMKPVYNKSMILMGDGSRKRLEDVTAGDEVVTHTGAARRVSAVHEQGELPVLKITTESGREVETAYDHPFLTPDGWVQAGNLKVGDTLACVVPDDEGNALESLEAFRLAGYFIGDGNTSASSNPTSSQAVITCFDAEQCRDIEQCGDALGFTVSPRPNHRLAFSAGSASIQEWLRDVELARKTSWSKRVPEFVFRGDAEQIGHFLGAYFACDGSLNQKGHKRKDLAVTFYSVNVALLRDVQHLLLRIGVRSRLRKHINKNNNYTGGVYESWRLTITSQDDTAKLVARMPIYGQKARKLATWGIERADFDKTLLPDAIVGIEPAGEKECRCLTVEVDHSFLAEDLAVHNSLTTCVLWPTWEWIENPSLGWLFGSYGQSLATRDALASRRLIQSTWYQERFGESFTLTGDQNAKIRYDNSEHGYRIATSVGGMGTGEGADRLVLDDPHKADEATSESLTELLAAVEWHNTTWSTRANSSLAARVVIMQRLHELDIVGDIQEKMQEGGRHYEQLILPAEYEPSVQIQVSSLDWKDPRTEEGELLWPERFTHSEIESLKVQLQDAASGQLQQRPAPAGGAIIQREWFEGEPTFFFEDHFEHINEAIPQRNRYQLGNYYLKNLVLQRWVSYDTAFKDKDVNDPTGIVVWERLGNGILMVRYAEEVRLTVPEIEDRIKEDFHYWDFDNKLVGMVIEDKGSGIGILQTLKRTGRGITNYNGKKTLANSLIPFDPKQDSKEFRARQASVWLRRDCVWLPEQSLKTPWLPIFEDRLFKFPFSKTKDMVDAFTQFILYSEPRIQKGWETRSGFYKQAAEEKRKRKLEYESRAV